MAILEGKHQVIREKLSVRNISSVVEDGLCTGCGTCCGVCPPHAIEMTRSKGLLLPAVDTAKCTSCLLCLKSCPGFSLDFHRLNMETFGKQPEDRYLGNLRRCFLGHSNDAGIRAASSSGGVASQLLAYLLKNRLIEAAVIARAIEDKPLEPEPFVARTEDEVLSGSRSKYCPVAIGQTLQKMRISGGRFAVVGLPCHIHGIRKAEVANPSLKRKIVMHIGLFCGHTVSFDGTDFVLERLGVRRADVTRLYYRGNSWPDSMRVETKDNQTIGLRYNRSWNAYWNVFSPFFFTPLRCLMCPDQFNELADISVGDAWLSELKDRDRGESLIIARTAAGEELLRNAQRDGFLFIEGISPEKVKESQAFNVSFKKKHYARRLRFLYGIGQNVPRVRPLPSSAGSSALIGAVVAYVSYRISSNRRLRSFLVSVPLPVFRLYFALFRCVF